MYGYSLAHHFKPIGAYLLEAGLLSQGQVDVALADQKFTEMSFGEIVVARGWVKQQTVDYFMQKVVLPERAAAQRKLLELEAPLPEPAELPAPKPTPQAEVNRLTRQKLITSPGVDDNEVRWID